MSEPKDNRKLFFGLFIFPLVIAIGMATLLCSVVFLTHEKETPETLIADIKKSSPGKRWQKAFELSNELNRIPKNKAGETVQREISQILRDNTYDAKTRGYMALALTHFDSPEALSALRAALTDPDDDVRLFVLWALGVVRDTGSVRDILPYLKSASPDIRKTSAYVLGAIGDPAAAPELRKSLNDPVSDVRWNAALALARVHDDSGLSILLGMMDREALSERHELDEAQIEAVMINAAKGLALIRKPEATKILGSVSRGDKNMKVRQAALDALNFQTEKRLS